MPRPDSFDDWIGEEFSHSNGFTALILLVGISDRAVEPLRSTYVHVIGDEIDWARATALLAGAGVGWDGVMFQVMTSEGGGPVTDMVARQALRDLEQRVAENRLVINEGHFFDKWGRRMMVEEAGEE